MNKGFRLPIVIATAIATLALCASAQAAPVTIGSPLTGIFTPTLVSGEESTGINLSPFEPGTHATSPVNGAIVRWHLLASEGGPFKLRVMRPVSETVYTAVGSSAPATASSSGLETYATALPVQAGDTIGLDAVSGTKLGVYHTPLSTIAAWGPRLAEGESRAWTISLAGGEYGFNAEVQPQPTVTSITPLSGATTGGTPVTIAGTDFASVSAVRFGTNAAASYAVGSEGLITALAPPGAPSTTNITVTTVAGTSPINVTDKFSYTVAPSTAHCTVPKLIGKNLKVARKGLAKVDCKLGKVGGKKSRSSKVKKQSPKAGAVLPVGSKVSVKLG